MDDIKINEILQRMVADNVPEKNIIDYFSRKWVDINDWISKQEQNNWWWEQVWWEQWWWPSNNNIDNQSWWGYETDEALAWEDSEFSRYLKEYWWKALSNAQYLKDAKLWEKAIKLGKNLLEKWDKNLLHFLVWSKWGTNLSVPFSQLSKAQQATLLKQAAWKILWAVVTVWGTMYDVNQDNKKALTKSSWNAWLDFAYSLLDSVDRATEYAPIVSLFDLWWDLVWAAVGKDENWESYSKWWLVSKVSNAVEWMLWIDNWARTFWQNTPEQQLEDLQNRKWMENQWFKWEFWNWLFWDWLSAKEWSKADIMLKNDKAIDTIQWNTKGKWQKSTDWVSADLEQQHKRDANMYISWKNRSEWKKLDAKDAYTYKDFTKEFVQAPDWSWKKKKWWADAWDLWRKMKKNSEKPEWETINI